ncbi:hypothetical protein [Bergeyella zoohelcum]|uniref:Uncharacterized protein n=1 Tax=Bergeyella zoohelcum TaxID=1015 RepID=A0A7Z8YSL7_9FLAO|nr:hypothetical protein [Bergeyella zoohelcum]VDH05884.1 Uncharacterised protein [Bergeyella zoohelcum]
MNSTATKLQKTSDIVFQELKKLGFSKYFNWVDYHYFKKEAENENLTGYKLANKITELFLEYNNEVSDLSEYIF